MTTIALFSGPLAFLLTLSLVPLVIRISRRRRIFDHPGPLKIHSKPVPRLGGIAVVLALLAAIVASPAATLRSWTFFAALILVWVAGLSDDLWSVLAIFRFAAQIAAGLLLWHGGWTIDWFSPAWANAVATCVFVAGFSNAMNLLDGSDGLSAGVAAVVAVAYAVILGARGDALGMAVACSLIGACLAFLAFNLPPASIFLGDSGSTTLGFCVAFLALDFWRGARATPSNLAFPLLLAALPLLDTAFAIARRISSGVSPFYGDRRHIYDLLFKRGWSARRVALVWYAASATLAIIASFGLRRESWLFWLAAAFCVLALCYLAVRLGALRMNDGRKISRDASRRLENDVAVGS